MPLTAGFFGKVIVVTGAAAGVGRAIALRFAREGAKLGLISRDEAALEALAGEIRADGGVAAVAALDVSDAEAIFAAANQFERDLGPIDLWVNDAMLTVFAAVDEIWPEEFRRVTETTYLGAVHGAMAALKHMRPRRRGQIVNIGSALAYRGIPLQAAYCGAKHAIRGFTASLRAELEHDGLPIVVSLIELPAVNTPQFDWARTHRGRLPRPMGTVYQPEVAAEAVVRAARGGAREYWVGASTLLTIVGNMIAPAFMDRYLARTAVAGQETRRIAPADRRDNLIAPVTDLHRVHGSFGAEAKWRGWILPGDEARAAIIIAGAALFFALGRRSERRPSRRRRF